MTQTTAPGQQQFEAEQVIFKRVQIYPTKLTEFRDLLARYYTSGTDADDDRHRIAAAIETALISAHYTFKFDGAFQQLVNVFAGQPVYVANAVGEWTGISSSFLVVPELKNIDRAIDLIEAATLRHDDPAMRYLTDAYAERGEFAKLDELVSVTDGEILKHMNLRVCFDRAKAIHIGNDHRNIHQSRKAVDYLAPLFGPPRANKVGDQDMISLRNSAVFLTRQIAEHHGVLGKAFDLLAIRVLRAESASPELPHSVVKELINDDSLDM